MKTPHTPGPWLSISKKRPLGDDGPLCIISKHEKLKKICEVGSYSSSENHANARLIASAPELLDAVDSCLEIMVRAIGERLPVNLGTECEETDWLTAIRKARSAMAKAKGEA